MTVIIVGLLIAIWWKLRGIATRQNEKDKGWRS